VGRNGVFYSHPGFTLPYRNVSGIIGGPSEPHEVALMLARPEFGGPAIFWGVLWLVISLAAIAFSVRYAFGSNRNLCIA
jgi:hypothetical protein